MKKIVFFLLLSLLLISCNPQEEKSTFLFNDISFKLFDGEEITPTNLTKKEDFNSYFENDSIQIPLFKIIKAENYIIYIGIPYNTSFTELTDYNLSKKYAQTFIEGDTTHYYRKSYTADNKSITTHIKNFDNNLLYILTDSDSEALSDSLFNKKTMLHRFITK